MVRSQQKQCPTSGSARGFFLLVGMLAPKECGFFPRDWNEACGKHHNPDRQNSSVSHSSELIAAICAGQAPTYKGHPFASQAGGNGSGRYRVGGGRKSEGIPGRNTNRKESQAETQTGIYGDCRFPRKFRGPKPDFSRRVPSSKGPFGAKLFR